MNKVEGFIRLHGHKYLLPYADESDIYVSKKYTAFTTHDHRCLKIKNADLLTYHYLHESTDIQLENFFKKVNPKWLAWLLGE